MSYLLFFILLEWFNKKNISLEHQVTAIVVCNFSNTGLDCNENSSIVWAYFSMVADPKKNNQEELFILVTFFQSQFTLLHQTEIIIMLKKNNHYNLGLKFSHYF